jgi:hypothetical protein
MPLYGIEQEIPMVRDGQTFVDASNTGFEELQAIVDSLPLYLDDYPRLRVGDLGIKEKRWYVEGYERFLPNGSYEKTLPKSFEIRTVPAESPQIAIAGLSESYQHLKAALTGSGFAPTWISYHPFKKMFIPDPPLNNYEINKRQLSPEMVTATIAQVTFGPDLNLSFEGMSDRKLIDAAKKLTYYGPAIVPFSFSSPFYDGKLWNGVSARTYFRSGLRPTVMVFLHDEKNFVPANPSLSQESRILFEKGRIEFKAFDTCNDPDLYLALFVLLEGLILDESLPGRAEVPDRSMYERAAQYGFSDLSLSGLASGALVAASNALDPWKAKLLLPLFEILETPEKLPVNKLIRRFRETQSIIKTLQTYENFV